jgi:hypothetical protein
VRSGAAYTKVIVLLQTGFAHEQRRSPSQLSDAGG